MLILKTRTTKRQLQISGNINLNPKFLSNTKCIDTYYDQIISVKISSKIAKLVVNEGSEIDLDCPFVKRK